MDVKAEIDRIESQTIGLDINLNRLSTEKAKIESVILAMHTLYLSVFQGGDDKPRELKFEWNDDGTISVNYKISVLSKAYDKVHEELTGS